MKSVLKQQHESYIYDIEELKSIEEKQCIGKFITIRTKRKRQMVNDKNDSNSCTPLFIVEAEGHKAEDKL